MKVIKIYNCNTLSKINLFSLLIVLFVQVSLCAQCSDVYLYRVNNSIIQSESSIYVFHEGQQIAVANLGDRYKTSICSPGQYEFVVKTDPNGVSIIKKSIQVETGNNYYLKLACLKVGDLATIDLVSKEKGNKDIQKGSKFKGAMRTLNISQPSITNNHQRQGGTEITTSTPINNSTDAAFQRVQTSHGFTFEVVNVSKAGDMLRMDYKITNNTGNDRILHMYGKATAFYDDLGNFFNGRRMCIMSSCGDNRIQASESIDYIHGDLSSSRYHTIYSVIPYGIPVAGSIVFRGLNNKATKFVRGGILFRSASKTNDKDFVDFKINYSNIIFPSEVDPNNPQNRLVGDVGIELKKAQREEENVKLSFNLKSTASDDRLIDIKGAQAYDNLGNEIKLLGLSFGTQEINKNRYQYKHTIPAFTNSYFNVWLSPLSKSASKILRVKVQFDGFELEWNDISISGTAERSLNTNSQSSNSRSSNIGSNNSANYIPYSDFEHKIKNRETLSGQRIILEKIHFQTGSDVITSDSNKQLNDLAELLKSNHLLKVEVSGHTDDIGDDVSNMLLSQKRADAIKYYMIAKGIKPERVKSVGKGETEPISNNTSIGSRKENRRVEIKVL